MPHLLVAGQLHPAGTTLLERLRGEGYSYDYVEQISEDSYAPLIDRADALVIRTQPLSAGTIARADRLKVVSRHGVGYDSVDVEALDARGIALTILGDVNSVSVAEHAMMQLLAAAKRARKADAAVRAEGQWSWRNQLEQQEISGKRLLILGYGRSGQRLARMASGFDMEITAFDPYLEKAGWPSGGARPVSDLGAALGWADYISVHVPKSDKPVISKEQIALMKRGVILVNTARGGVVCESALANALESGQIGAAGLDVFEEEPPATGSPLLAHDNLILSPHIAGLTAECSERMAIGAIGNAVDYLNGRIDPALVVNLSALGKN
jgi:D-3-phosphoglycerate dehydrogenase / 2-oxoglutarate reductase